jgi:hypothetical protein
MMRRVLPAILAPGLLCLPWSGAAAPKPSPSHPRELATQAEALFRSRCTSCHAQARPKAKLDLSSLAGLARGSRSGPVIAPARPDASLLWQMVRDRKMPPKKPLADADRALIREWIAAGAPGLVARSAVHWAFVPPGRPPVPAVRESARVRTAIDRFIEAALERKGLTLAPEADRLVLIRRVSFDLTGLPPTPAEIDAFVADHSPDAYERMVERYLASSRYGERWGKYWLDVAGYADSNGYFSADSDRPLAYRYRDYVIRSFNRDKPYDRFVCEQLAGDEMAGYVPGGGVTPDMVDLLTATHFLRDAPDGTGESDGNPDEVRTDRFSVLEGTLQITMNSLLGMTIQCARCHSHKFEPISHEEYYRLESIFYPVYNPERWSKPAERIVLVGSREQQEEYHRRNEYIDRQIKALEAGLGPVAAPLRDQLKAERLSRLSASVRAALRKAENTPAAKRTAEQAALLKRHDKLLQIGEDDLGKRFPEYAALREQVQKAIAARAKDRPHLDQLSVFVETDPNPPVHHLLLRGLHNRPGRKVEPGVPVALTTPADPWRLAPRPAGRVSTGRRTAFARWVTSPDNPLFARVMVNRIWQHHFGVGIVATPDNLGQSGARPTHPELLDYLATEFTRSGWSIKAVHRAVVRSAAYRQSSAPRDAGLRADPDNRLLWRFPLRRLDAEAVRDSMLAVAGELDHRMAGPYVPTQRTGQGDVVVDEKHDGAHRGSVYLQQRRTQVATLLELFDAPSIATNCSARTTSTVPLQSLALLNSEFARARAAALARRLAQEAGTDTDRRLTTAFRLIAGRAPTAAETDAARRFIAAQMKVYSPDAAAVEHTWTDLCQMLLASNAFLYVE